MRKSREETAETRRTIVKSASERFRAKGVAATGLSEIMSEAGLTHGGFYRHFESKDELIRDAIETSAQALIEELEGVLRSAPKDAGLEALAKTYLAIKHRDDPETGCPLVGMGSEISRAEPSAREIATAFVRRLIALTNDQLDGAGVRSARQATAIVAMWVGALTLSRIVSDEKLSNDLLKSAVQATLDLNASK